MKTWVRIAVRARKHGPWSDLPNPSGVTVDSARALQCAGHIETEVRPHGRNGQVYLIRAIGGGLSPLGSNSQAPAAAGRPAGAPDA